MHLPSADAICPWYRSNLSFLRKTFKIQDFAPSRPLSVISGDSATSGQRTKIQKSNPLRSTQTTASSNNTSPSQHRINAASRATKSQTALAFSGTATTISAPCCSAKSTITPSILVRDRFCCLSNEVTTTRAARWEEFRTLSMVRVELNIVLQPSRMTTELCIQMSATGVTRHFK